MRQIAFVLVAAMPLAACAQETPTESSLRDQVAQIAALAVKNTDSIEELKTKVAALRGQVDSQNGLIQELLGRVTDLENRRGLIPASENRPLPIAIESPPLLPIVYQASPAPQPAPITIQRSRTITRTIPQGGRTFRTPVRNVFRWILRGRNVTATSMTSGHWSYPGDLTSHLSGYPHYIDRGYLATLSYSQKLSLHDSLHSF